MRKAILLTAATAFLVVPAMVQAQATDNATVTATANIPAMLSFDQATDDFDFGTVEAGQPATVAPSSGATFEITRNVGFSWTFDGSVLENLADPSVTIPVRWDCDFDGAGTVACTDLVSVPAPTGRVTETLLVGGHLDGDDTAAVVPGDYEGTVTITITEDI